MLSKEEIEKLLIYFDGYGSPFDETIKQLVEENERLRKELRFYADENNYKENVLDQWRPVVPINEDGGERARKALEGK
ncbi:hypothetical protein BEP19_09925 [Ammoniphilus oxalaticus]|uniref:Uncharacterized protein n=1 Tax=Ammoniphilus oxalaticus TaxID=66863 RepID=A0A419SFL0_9BACL|nr:hypothetical protein [Ammoniphilus oxalaticus]RKD22569.1 hypothetical protein BEP19_09925 [Ammoniphilus oxalaticus]